VSLRAVTCLCLVELGLLDRCDHAHAFLHGFSYGLRISALICLGGALCSAILVRRFRYAESDVVELAPESAEPKQQQERIEAEPAEAFI
jgi:hypothetical protein